ncbi:MAG: FAD-binding oxidoreductase [Rhodobacter sp.]|nr:FAD-binding oxidoreductase [Rhodobacter sp.]
MKPHSSQDAEGAMDHSLAPVPEDLAWLAPSSNDELVDLLRRLKVAGSSACVRGGGCSTNGRSVAELRQIRMHRFDGIRIDGQTLICGGGTTLQTVARALRANGHWLPVLPSSPTATVGGVLAAGGFGPASLRHGGLYAALREVSLATPSLGVVRVCRDKDPEGVFSLIPGSLGGLGPIVEARLALMRVAPPLLSTERVDSRPLQQIAEELIDGPAEAATLVSADLQGWRVLTYASRTTPGGGKTDLHADLHEREQAFQRSEASWIEAVGLKPGRARRIWVDFLVPLRRIGELQNAFVQEASFPGSFQVYHAMVFDERATASAAGFPFLPLAGKGPVVSLGTYVTFSDTSGGEFIDRIEYLRALTHAIGGRQYLHGPHPQQHSFYLEQFGRPALDRFAALRRSFGLDALLPGF